MAEIVHEEIMEASAGNDAQMINSNEEISGLDGEISNQEDKQEEPSKQSSKRKKKSSSKSGRRHSKSSGRTKRRRYSSSDESSSSSSSDSSSTENDEEDEPTTKRFRVMTEEERHKYSLPKSMANYVNEQFEVFIPEKELKDAVLLENPVPENIDPTKKLDDFLKGILKERKKTDLINQDNILEKVQGRIRGIMGPLSRVWMMIESARESSERKVTVSLDDLQSFVEQTVLMVGQCSNTVSYHRRLNVLQCLTDSQA